MQVTVAVAQRAFELSIVRVGGQRVRERIARHLPLRFTDGRNWRPVVSDHAIGHRDGLVDERALQAGAADVETPRRQRVISLPQAADGLELGGRHLGTEALRPARHAKFVGENQECEHDEDTPQRSSA